MNTASGHWVILESWLISNFVSSLFCIYGKSNQIVSQLDTVTSWSLLVVWQLFRYGKPVSKQHLIHIFISQGMRSAFT